MCSDNKWPCLENRCSALANQWFLCGIITYIFLSSKFEQSRLLVRPISRALLIKWIISVFLCTHTCVRVCVRARLASKQIQISVAQVPGPSSTRLQTCLRMVGWCSQSQFYNYFVVVMECRSVRCVCFKSLFDHGLFSSLVFLYSNAYENIYY